MPSQTGIVLSTQGIIELYKLTAANEECPIEYLLPSRATTEGVENQFSAVRQDSGEGDPGPLKTKQTLRNNALTQSVAHPRGANYAAVSDQTALTLADMRAEMSIEAKRSAEESKLNPPVLHHRSVEIKRHSKVTEKGIVPFFVSSKLFFKRF